MSARYSTLSLFDPSKIVNSYVETYARLVEELADSMNQEKETDETSGEFAATPFDVVARKGRVRLLHYKPMAQRTVKVPLLLVYALINRYYILDLQKDRSVVRRYLERGLDVYIIDWGNPRYVDRYEDIGDYVDYIDDFVRVIQDRSGSRRINLQGYCIGGTLCAIYSALYPEKVNALIIQAAPIDFSTNAGVLNIWARHIDADKVVDTLGNVSSQFLNSSFLLLNPARLLIDKYVSFYENIGNREYVDNFLRMERWIFDSPDMPGEFYRQFIKDLYQRNKLVKGQLTIDEKRPVDLHKITAPLLVVVAEDDNLVTPDSTIAITNYVSSPEKEIMRFNGGHIGLSVSPSSHRKLWPNVAEWLLIHSPSSS